jgi:hypothetical protein
MALGGVAGVPGAGLKQGPATAASAWAALPSATPQWDAAAATTQSSHREAKNAAGKGGPPWCYPQRP